ncbi:MAG: ATP-binding protein [Candidatus Aenigmarchaeota archaeon]|nr:ATP-binding protein [Candidatus Aenigmarchaeota archaeon]
MNKLEKWIDRKEIFVIRGPRQAGKTTLMLVLKESLIRKGISPKNIVFLRCDDYDAAEPFVRDHKAFVRAYAPLDSEKYYFFLDEYQYIPDGGRRLKILYDSFPNIKFIVSGSSSLELTGKTAKYLVGRVFYFALYPFSFGEFVNAKDEKLAQIYRNRNKAIADYILTEKDPPLESDIFLKEILKLFEEYMVFGGYPEVIKADNIETKKMILKSIYETYIGKDIVELLKMRDVITFRNIVSLLAAQHAGILSFDSIASDSKSYYKEVKWFLSVLEETYVLRLLMPFHKNLSTELKKSPKSYFIDTGLRNHIARNFSPLPFREDRGRLAEGIVLSSLISLLDGETEIRYWRTLAKAEVDFVVLSPHGPIPVEVKYQSFKKPKVSRSLRSFIEAYRPKRAVIVTADYWNSMELGQTRIKFVPACYL